MREYLKINVYVKMFQLIFSMKFIKSIKVNWSLHVTFNPWQKLCNICEDRIAVNITTGPISKRRRYDSSNKPFFTHFKNKPTT